MRLKSLELRGFKSFPDATLLTFPHALTAIVGPNGSGKSNLSDAIRWVLGEQSAKTLRGGRMEDVIFSGAQERPRQGFAQVTLTLEPSREGEEGETAVTRKYYRSGESEYYLNGRQVRLKDVTDRFLDTGLGQDGYALIGQGRIDEVLSAKPTQRREIFEEAAGIAHCRRQKEETGRKLAQAQENLTRLQDKLEELQLQREPLRKGAEKAMRHAALAQELQELEVSQWLKELEDQRRQGDKLSRDLDTARAELARWQQETDRRYARSEALVEDLRLAQIRRAELAQQKTKLEEARQTKEKTIALLRAQLDMGQTTAQRLAEEGRTNAAQEAALAQEEADQTARAEELKTALHRAGEALAQARDRQKALEAQLAREAALREGELRQRRETLAFCRTQAAQAEEAWLARRMEVDSLSAKAKALEDLTKGYEGYARAVKTAMTAARDGRLPGVLGPVGERFHVAAPYALALETALGGAVNHILVENEEAGKAVLRWVKERRSGRVTCLPLTALRPRPLGEGDIAQAPGYVAIAADLVDCDEKSRPAAQALLGRTVVVENLDHGVALAKATGYRFPVVTLEGEILRPGGTMTGGSQGPSAGALARGARVQELARSLDQAKAGQETALEALHKARRAVQTAQEALDDWEQPKNEAPSQARTAAAQGEETIRTLSQQVAHLEGAQRGGDPLLRQLAQQRTRLNHQREALEAQAAALSREQTAQREELAQATAQEAELEAKLQALAGQVNERSQQVLALEGERTQAERDARAGNDTLLGLQRETALLEGKVLQARGEEKRLLDRLWDTYGLTHQAAQRLQVPLEGTAKTGRRIGQLKEEIRKLGQVNPAAVEEFQRVEERYTYLRDQKTDVETAKAKLEEVIEVISGEMAAVFLEEFDKIRGAFAQTFAALFGGGRGELVLEDPAHPLDTGVEIKVQPPGKTLRTLSLLSGGERALVAIALYFAMVRVHPTPFCVVDEIEAALDEGNSLRFARSLQEMAADTQFLLITHRRTTMEAAQMLYGVTMEQQGVSRVLRLDLEQVEAVLGEELK